MRTPEQIKAQKDYVNDQIEAGRKRLPSSFMPEDVQSILESMVESSTDPKYGISSAVWECVRSFEKKHD